MKKTNNDEGPRKPHVVHPTPAEVLNMKAAHAPTLAEDLNKKESLIPIAQPKYTLEGGVKRQ